MRLTREALGFALWAASPRGCVMIMNRSSCFNERDCARLELWAKGVAYRLRAHEGLPVNLDGLGRMRPATVD
jgi:hypothetical protein